MRQAATTATFVYLAVHLYIHTHGSSVCFSNQNNLHVSLPYIRMCACVGALHITQIQLTHILQGCSKDFVDALIDKLNYVLSKIHSCLCHLWTKKYMYVHTYMYIYSTSHNAIKLRLICQHIVALIRPQSTHCNASHTRRQANTHIHTCTVTYTY